jgi:hypothetical protein
MKDYHHIKIKNFEILVSERLENDIKYNNTIMGEDNVVMIKSKYSCLLFDEDLDAYLADHALPIKSPSESNIGHHFDKAGMIEEDVRNILRVTIH